MSSDSEADDVQMVYSVSVPELPASYVPGSLCDLRLAV